MMNDQTYYLVACSGGPDSMALLDSMRKSFKICVAHVNYHKRESALRDEKIVEAYCKKYNLTYFKKDAYYMGEGNFQNWARVVRYDFFLEIYKKYPIKALCTAHHFDDHLETYLLQKKRGSIPFYYGISNKSTYKEMPILRPLLMFSKVDLIEYCKRNKIIYGLDESNASDAYLRNRIRHQIIDHLTMHQKRALQHKIIQENRLLKEKREDVRTFLKGRSELDERAFMDYKDPHAILREWLYDDLSLKYLNELLRQVKTSEHFEVIIQDKTFYKEYHQVGFYITPKSYCVRYDRLMLDKREHYSIVEDADNFHAATVSEADFPLYIRSFQKGDRIMMRYGRKKIARFFIDHKIKSYKRKVWPIVVNCKGDIILVPKIGADVFHYSIKPNLFVVE